MGGSKHRFLPKFDKTDIRMMGETIVDELRQLRQQYVQQYRHSFRVHTHTADETARQEAVAYWRVVQMLASPSLGTAESLRQMAYIRHGRKLSPQTRRIYEQAATVLEDVYNRATKEETPKEAV